MVLPLRGMRRSRAIKSRGDKRRGDAVQTRIRGGCSGGGWPRPSGHESFRREAMRPAAVRSGWIVSIDAPVKHMEVHAAMKTHLSQPIGAGALDGQHGMSLAISSVVSEADMSPATACILSCIDMSEGIPVMTGRETGANARPAIIKTASSRRMARYRFTALTSHKTAAKKRSSATAPCLTTGRRFASTGKSGLRTAADAMPATSIGKVRRSAATYASDRAIIDHQRATLNE
jgi:hypothetical protein